MKANGTDVGFKWKQITKTCVSNEIQVSNES